MPKKNFIVTHLQWHVMLEDVDYIFNFKRDVVVFFGCRQPYIEGCRHLKSSSRFNVLFVFVCFSFYHIVKKGGVLEGKRKHMARVRLAMLLQTPYPFIS